MTKNNQTSIPTPTWVMLSPMARFSQGPHKFNREPERVPRDSRTIPDDSFTIKELFDRYQKGAPLPIGLERPVRFQDDPTHSDLDMGRILLMDISEIHDYRKRVADTLYQLNERKTALETASEAKQAENVQFPGSPS